MADERSGAASAPRSPAYPQHGLKRAVELIRAVYEGAHRAEIGNEAVAGLMGYRSMSGPATAAIGAVKQFGLLEGRDPKLKITPLALSILEPLNDNERRRALFDAAHMPSPFDDLLKEFGSKRPAENVLRSIAIRRYNFSGSGGDRFVDVYLDTLSFLEAEGAVEREERDSEPELTRVIEPEGLPTTSAARPPSIAVSAPLPAGERLEFRLTPESRAVVVFSGSVTQQAVEKLVSILSVLKDTFPDETAD